MIRSSVEWIIEYHSSSACAAGDESIISESPPSNRQHPRSRGWVGGGDGCGGGGVKGLNIFYKPNSGIRFKPNMQCNDQEVIMMMLMFELQSRLASGRISGL